MKIYREYFQKSKVFIYPLLQIRKGVRFVPIETYISWDNKYTIKDYMFICLYKIDSKKESAFRKFEKDIILSNRYFHEYYKHEDYHIYVFDLSKYKHDWSVFIEGKYSKFSDNAKQIITDFFGKDGTISEYVESYIYPSYYHEDYAEDLGVTLQELKDIHELCSKPEFEKENCEIKLTEIELFNNNSISLDSKN